MMLQRFKKITNYLVAIATLLIAAQPVQSYHLFTRGGNPTKWATTGVVFRADTEMVSGVTFLSLAVTATGTWNAVTDAMDIYGTPTLSGVNFTGANLGTAWGVLTGDGLYELAYDADGSALTALGLNPATVNGYGPSNTTAAGVINDAFFVVNGTRADFDLLSTMVHELGHILGIAHSSVGMHNSSTPDTALDPIALNSVPTMHPFSLGAGNTSRRTLEPDDMAAMRELYPEAGAATRWGGIQGEIRRCGTSAAVTGANVRAINTANTAIQLSRFTSYDGNGSGRYVINYLPPGTYRIVVEPLGVNGFTLNRFGNPPNSAESDFDFEYLSPPTPEAACTEPIPEAAADIQTVNATAGVTQINNNIFVQSPVLAFVVDDTGSMTEEIGGVRAILTAAVNSLAARTPAQPFPLTAVVTFKDDVTKRIVSNDPASLRTVIGALFASGGGDCPEASNAALLVAGSMLKRNGVAILFTDADSRPDGPSRSTVTSYFRSKGVRLSVLLSGTCTGTVTSAVPGVPALKPSDNGSPVAQVDQKVAPSPRHGSTVTTAGEEYPPEPVLGTESAPTTFSNISNSTGGFFVAIPGINAGDATETQRYINTGTNLSLSAVVPAVALVNPTNVPRGATLNIEVNGSNTNFVAGQSAVSISGAGVTVNSVTVLSPTLLNANITVAAGAALGFRDISVVTNLGGGTTETAAGLGEVNVIAAPTTPQTISVTPSQGGQGQDVMVRIDGTAVAFNATSAPSFGSGVTVLSSVTLNATSLTALVRIASDATVGYRRVTVTTGGVATADSTPTGAFQVTGMVAAIPVISSVVPNSGDVGTTLNIALTGVNTNFVAGSTTVTVSGTGVTTNSVTVSSPTQLVANITIAAAAPLGFRDVTAVSGGQTAAILNGFRVTSSGGGGGGSPVTFRGTDTATQGNWIGKYGMGGYLIANDGSAPTDRANVSLSQFFTYTWANMTLEPRALQTPGGSGSRIASAFTNYVGKSIFINVNVYDSVPHRVALYMLDWDTSVRSQTVTITDASTGQLYDTQSFSGFRDGQYAAWDIQGNVVIRVTPTSGPGPVVSGIFFN